MQNLIPTTEQEANETKGAKILCYVCGRAVPMKKGTGRGRTKTVHSNCSIIASRLAEMERLLAKVEFGDAEHVQRMRGNLFAITNKTLRASVVKINPDSDEDI